MLLQRSATRPFSGWSSVGLQGSLALSHIGARASGSDVVLYYTRFPSSTLLPFFFLGSPIQRRLFERRAPSLLQCGTPWRRAFAGTSLYYQPTTGPWTPMTGHLNPCTGRSFRRGGLNDQPVKAPVTLAAQDLPRMPTMCLLPRTTTTIQMTTTLASLGRRHPCTWSARAWHRQRSLCTRSTDLKSWPELPRLATSSRPARWQHRWELLDAAWPTAAHQQQGRKMAGVRVQGYP